MHVQTKRCLQMQDVQNKIPAEGFNTGACYDCPKELNGCRLNPPVNLDSDGRTRVICLAQNGRCRSSRTDIEHYAECKIFQHNWSLPKPLIVLGRSEKVLWPRSRNIKKLAGSHKRPGLFKWAKAQRAYCELMPESAPVLGQIPRRGSQTPKELCRWTERPHKKRAYCELMPESAPVLGQIPRRGSQTQKKLCRWTEWPHKRKAYVRPNF